MMEPGAISLKATGRGRRRLLVNRVAEGAAGLFDKKCVRQRGCGRRQTLDHFVDGRQRAQLVGVGHVLTIPLI